MADKRAPKPADIPLSVFVTRRSSLSFRRSEIQVPSPPPIAANAASGPRLAPPAFITAAIPTVIISGLLRLLRERGVTAQAVAGALTIYLSLGLLFAWIISFITHVDSTLYFAQHTDGTEGDRVYFSFTVLTTTGFGDFSPSAPAGHALAVIEMLTGQLYLVTVIGLLIGNFVGRQKTA